MHRHPAPRAIATGAIGFALVEDRSTLGQHQRGRIVDRRVLDDQAQTLVDATSDDWESVEESVEEEAYCSDLQQDACSPTTQLCVRRESYLVAGGYAPWCSGRATGFSTHAWRRTIRSSNSRSRWCSTASGPNHFRTTTVRRHSPFWWPSSLFVGEGPPRTGGRQARSIGTWWEWPLALQLAREDLCAGDTGRRRLERAVAPHGNSPPAPAHPSRAGPPRPQTLPGGEEP